MQKQVDAERVKLGQERHKVFQTAAQAIDVPGHHKVELALGGVPAQRIERRPSIAALSAITCQPARSAAWRSSCSWLDVVWSCVDTRR